MAYTASRTAARPKSSATPKTPHAPTTTATGALTGAALAAATTGLWASTRARSSTIARTAVEAMICSAARASRPSRNNRSLVQARQRPIAFVISAVALVAGCKGLNAQKQRCLAGDVLACESACNKGLAGEGGCFQAGNAHREHAALDF